MARWGVKEALSLAWPCTYVVQQVADYAFVGTLAFCGGFCPHGQHSAILCGADNEVGLGQVALPQQREHVSSAVADMDEHPRSGGHPDLRDHHAQPCAAMRSQMSVSR